MRILRRVSVLLSAAGSVSAAHAQWLPNYQNYSIQRLGLFGPEHTDSAGFQYSTLFRHSAGGFTSGSSNLYNSGGTYAGESTWVFSPLINATVRTGFTGPGFSGSTGRQQSENNFHSANGQVAGRSSRYTGSDEFSDNGWSSWVYRPASNTTVHTGLTGPEHTGSAGYQNSANTHQNDAGQVAGYSSRITGVSTINGQNTWVYNPVSNTTVQIGLIGAAYTGSAGYQFSDNSFQSAAGMVAGYSVRVSGVSTDDGRHTWVYNPATNSTVRTGLTGPEHTGSGGYQDALNTHQTAAGHVAGVSYRIVGMSQTNGLNTWIYNPISNTTVQTGLSGSEHIASNGFRYSKTDRVNAAGQVVGYSERWIGTTYRGIDAWMYDPSANTTVPIGLTGASYTPSSGLRNSRAYELNESGQVTGISGRYDSTGSTSLGAAAWFFNPAGNTTVRIGLTGAAQTGTSGQQHSEPYGLNAAGQVTGTSYRLGSSFAGSHAWVYNPATNTTVQVGLTGPAHTGSTGYQYSFPSYLTESGFVLGSSNRIRLTNLSNGANTWVYNPATGTTIPTGLTGAAYTGSSGYQYSLNQLWNEAGQIAGYSTRVVGVSSSNGQDAWYYDPVSQVTTAIVGSVRTIDNYAYSAATILTEGGFLLGNYQYFPGGDGSGEQRAFIFRPDLGLTDLGNLVSGGLTANGWSTLQNPVFSDALKTIVGYGYVNGQTTGRSVFIMIPTPGAASLVVFGGLIATARRRRG